MASFLNLLTKPEFRNMLSTDNMDLALSLAATFISSLLPLVYGIWVLWLFCKRARRLPRHYIIWLLLMVLLTVKTFVSTLGSDVASPKMLLIYLLAAAILIPCVKRSQQAKNIFIAP